MYNTKLVIIIIIYMFCFFLIIIIIIIPGALVAVFYNVSAFSTNIKYINSAICIDEVRPQ